jgi:ABC-type multidrug transport system permease subunit
MWFAIISAVIIGNDWLNDGIHYKIFGGHLFLTIWAIILVVKAFFLFFLMMNGKERS